MKYIASCSCGKDSLAMILTLIEKEFPLDYVVFFDAGKEFESIYRNWNKLTVLLDKHNIKYKVLKPNNSFDYYFAEHVTKTGKKGYSWCGGVCRWMTTMKVKAINDFYDQFNEPIVEYIGIANDEQDRITLKRNDKTVKVYPLALFNMTENDCLVKCYKNGFEWKEGNGVDLYDVLDRVSCYCCANKNLKELKAIYKHLPIYWQKLKDMQTKTYKTMNKRYSFEQLENKFDKNDID